MANPVTYLIILQEKILSQIHLLDVILSLLGLFIFSSIQQRLTTKGPMIWPVIGIIPAFLRHVNELYQWSTGSLVESGGTFHYKAFWFANCQGIITSDPIKIEYMLKTKFSNFPKGGYFRERFHELLGDGIFNADGEIWKVQRRIATSEMHTSRFLEYSQKVMQDLVHNKLLKLIEQKARDGGGIVDLQEWLLRFTFDNVCIVAFGVDPGCLGLDLPEVPFAKAFEEATQYSLFRFLVPPFVWKSMRYLSISNERKLKEAVRIVHEFAENTVKKRKVDVREELAAGSRRSSSDHDDLLSRLLVKRILDQNADHGSNPTTEEAKSSHSMISDKFLSDLCISFILAGRDTSSVGITWFFWLLHHHPRVETKILNSIAEIIGQRPRTSTTGAILFTSEELEKMVYLQAALSESMRLYPPVPIDIKEVHEDDVYPDGLKIHKGDRVFYHVYAMGRMESIWGKDCNEFRPERWIKDDGNLITENQFKYAVFNGGPRLCAGKKFAYLQMKMIVASVLLRYKVKVVEDQVISPKLTTTLYMKNGLLVRFEPRDDCLTFG